jgi:YjbE family integral membrane protein
MLEEIASQAFWIGLAKIIGVNIVLSGDNAVVIALAARSLPQRQQKLAIFWGAGAAVPLLKIVGAVLLLWIGVKLLVPEDDGDDVNASDNLMTAIKTILIADLVMSIDNVIAVAAAAQGSYLLLILGLAISIPLVIFGATLLVHLMERYPVIITIGAGLIGFVAGEMLVTDPALAGWMSGFGIQFNDGNPTLGEVRLALVMGVVGAVVVVLWGKWLAKRQEAAAAAQIPGDAGKSPNS